MRRPASGGGGAAKGSATSTRRGRPCATVRRSTASASSPSRRPTPTSGSAPTREATSRPPAATRAGASSIAITPSGARCATRPSSAGWSPFSEALPRIRKRVEADLPRHGLSRDKVLATIVRLLECSCIRVGNEEYARNNESFGLTTLKDDHVEVSGSRIRFEFRGQERQDAHGGRERPPAREDRRPLPGDSRRGAVPVSGRERRTPDGGLRRRQRLHPPRRRTTTSRPRISAPGRGRSSPWMRSAGRARSRRSARASRTSLAAIDRVAEQLNNTRAVCRKYYVHPAVMESYLAGTLAEDADFLRVTERQGSREADRGGNSGARADPPARWQRLVMGAERRRTAIRPPRSSSATSCPRSPIAGG